MIKKRMLILLGVAAMFTGCGQKNVDYVASEETASVNAGETIDNSGGEATSDEADVSQVVDDGAVPKRVEETIENGGHSIKINADVVGGNSYGNMPIVSLSPVSFSEEDMKRYAETLFDNGEYKIVFPEGVDKESILNRKKELEAELNKAGLSYEEATKSEDYGYLAVELERINYELENFRDVPTNMPKYEDEGIKWYDYSSADYENKLCYMEGLYGGDPAFLYFSNEDGTSSVRFGKKKNFYTGYNVVSTGSLFTFSKDGDNSQNAEEITTGDAKAMADEFMNKLNVTDLTATDVFDLDSDEMCLYTKTGNDPTRCNGYAVYYSKVQNDLSIPFSSMITDTYTVRGDNNEITALGNESLMVYIRGGEVRGFTYFSPMKTEGTTDVKNVTNFGSIKDIAIEALKKKQEERGEDLYISKIEIGYARVSDPGDYTKMSLVPVIYFFEDDVIAGSAGATPLAVINIIDGSEIEVGEHFVG